jgi:hypothetical protein
LPPIVSNRCANCALPAASLEDICNNLGFSRTVLERVIREHDIPRPANPKARTKRGYRAYLRRS